MIPSGIKTASQPSPPPPASPPEHALNETNEAYRWGGPCSGGVTRIREPAVLERPGGAEARPPSPARPIPYAGLHSRRPACARAGGGRAPWRRQWGGEGCPLHPPGQC